MLNRPLYVQDQGVVIDAMAQVMASTESRPGRLRFLLTRLQDITGRRHFSDLLEVDLSGGGPVPHLRKGLIVECQPQDPAALARLFSPEGDRLVARYAARAFDEVGQAPDRMIVRSHSELAFDHDWRDSPYRERMLVPLNCEEGLNFIWQCRRDRLFVVSIARQVGQSPFTERERIIMATLCSVMRPLITELFLQYDPMEDQELSPAQQDVLKLALTGASEKQIARRLHRSYHTVHSHLRAIYQAYGVSSRAELMARFIDAKTQGDRDRYVRQTA